jgi:UDP-2,3-diacylglucosamine hydrolase
MPSEATVIVSDAHLERAPGATSDHAFHEFLRAVPDIGNHLILNGDVFEFWFEYRSVIPVNAFPTLVLLSQLRDRGVNLTVVGGNHDRWGGPFWRDRLSAEFASESIELDIGGYHAYVHHGDGLLKEQLGSRLLHWLTRRRLTTQVFRAIHPDLGMRLVRRLTPLLGSGRRDEPTIRRGAVEQEAFARDLLSRRPTLDLVILSHTHRAVLIEVAPRRWYLNPGSWWEKRSFAVVTPDGPQLRTFE